MFFDIFDDPGLFSEIIVEFGFCLVLAWLSRRVAWFWKGFGCT